MIAHIDEALTSVGKRLDSVATTRELEGLRKSIFQKVNAMRSPVDAPDSATITLDDASVQRIVDMLLTERREEDGNVKPQEPENRELYKSDTAAIREMFIKKDDALLLHGDT